MEIDDSQKSSGVGRDELAREIAIKEIDVRAQQSKVQELKNDVRRLKKEKSRLDLQLQDAEDALAKLESETAIADNEMTRLRRRLNAMI